MKPVWWLPTFGFFLFLAIELWMFHSPDRIFGDPGVGRHLRTAEAIVEGWLSSADVGRIDGDGFLYIEDRAKDMVLRAGENVYCAEVESAVYEHPDVYEAAVFGVPHERLGEEVACVIRLRAGSTLTDDRMQDFLAATLAPFKVPSRIAFTHDELPRNPSGKILKRELRETYFAGGG